MKNKIWLSLAKMGGTELNYINKAFETNWVAPLGPNVDDFENKLQNFLGEKKHVVALSAGTAAIHLALLQLGVGRGDEVICQSFTFAASANPITYLGATPVFVDSESETWNISPQYLEQAIEARKREKGKYPKAIVVAELYGTPAKLDEIIAIANKYNIPIVEDSAEALGSEYNNRKCGTFGQFGILSFNGNKIITTSGGGALVCNNEATAKKTIFYATQAREPFPYYQHNEIGYNYRLSNVCAGIGCGQMEVLPSYVSQRRATHDMYCNAFSNISEISVHTVADHRMKPNYWLTCITLNGKQTPDALRLALDKENIESRLLWKPLHLQPVFAECSYYGTKIAEDIFTRGLCLPSGCGLCDSDFERVIAVVKKFCNE